MADGAQPSRLERVAEAIAEGLRRLREVVAGDREGKASAELEALSAELRESLGPNERLFLAGAALESMDSEQMGWLAHMALEDWHRGLLDDAWRAAREAEYLDDAWEAAGKKGHA